MLWVGWFGFNAGSELASDNLAASAFCTTHFAAAAGGLAWAFYDWLTRGKPTVLGTASGIVAGLVCITPAAGFVNPMPALAMGAIAGIVCAFACSKIKNAFGYDDALDAFGVHGVGGTLGAILTGVFATRAAWDIGALNGASGTKLGLIEGGTRDQGPARRGRRDVGLEHRRHVHHPEDRRCDRRTPRHARGRSARPRRDPTRRGRLHLCVAFA